MKIFISAGHRGKGTGAIGFIDEGAECISLRNKIVADLKSIAPGATVIVDDDKAQLSSVVNSINKQSSSQDISLDIHFNSFSNSSANGCEVLVSQFASESTRSMANGLLNVVAATLGIYSRGVKKESAGQHNKLAMLSGIKPKAMLLEVCFVSNASDAAKYQQNKDALSMNIAKYLKNLL